MLRKTSRWKFSLISILMWAPMEETQLRASCRKFVAERSDFRLMKNLTVHNLCDIFTCRNRNRRVGCVAARGDSHMMRDIGLMYVEGEVKAGRLTGRTVLVIETSREIDPSQPGYSSREIQRLVIARNETGVR